MTQIKSSELGKYLSNQSTENAIPVFPVGQSDLKEWLSGLTPGQSRWVKDNGFAAEQNEIVKIPGPSGELAAVAIGLGQEEDSFNSPWVFSPLAKALPDGHYHIVGRHDPFLAALGWALAQYGFDHYQDKKNTRCAKLVIKDKAHLKEVNILLNGIALVRDLINTPTCDMGPSHLSAAMQQLATEFNADFSETVGDDLLTSGYRTIHAVGRAAVNEPRLLDLTWGRKDAPKVTLVGKGVCFDTGGLDLKPSSSMRLMKKDMGGAAHTLGLARIIMESGLDIRLRLLIPAVENNISGDAFRPGDIIKTYKGTSVEVDNTDAEGRLVLCDALALASEENPELILDYATLTGAARVALGTDIVPFFTDNDQLAHELMQYSAKISDPLWRLPLYGAYVPLLKSSCADLNNMGSEPFGGAIMAALFLKHFVKDPNKWAHFDVFAWNKSDRPGRPQGGEAMALRTVYAYLKDHFGK